MPKSKNERDREYRARHPERVAAGTRAASARYRAKLGAAYTVADRLYRRRQRAIERLSPGGRAAVRAAERALRAATAPAEKARLESSLARLERAYALPLDHDERAEIKFRSRISVPTRHEATSKIQAAAEREAAKWREKIAVAERGMSEPDQQ